MRKNRQISLQECYTILNIEKDATLEDVKKAYRLRAFELHPDLNPNVPQAGIQFQRLNEAYVALSQVLQTEESARKSATQSEEKEQKHDKTKEQQKKNTSGTYEKNTYTKDEAGGKKQQDSSFAQSDFDVKEEARKNHRTNAAAYDKEDVLRDLLHDPFARRVFEDIYSEVNKQSQDDTSAKKQPVSPPPSPPTSTPASEVIFGEVSSMLQSTNGFAGKLKGWFLQQIDEKQTIKMPASALFVGARIRLQIRRGLADELSSVEVVLPKSFKVGKPIRLRGLGKKVGKWQGDLYLTIETK